MSTPREQYDSMLDDLDAETKARMIDHVPFAKVLAEVDPVAYRTGMNDFQAVCDECGNEFWADDPDAPAVCSEKSCQESLRDPDAEEEEEEEEEDDHA